MHSRRYYELKELLDTQRFFKVICGAGNEDPEQVKRLSIIYTLAGATGIDVSANPDIVRSCNNGINYAFEIAEILNIQISTKPFITVSVGMPGDHHVRKAIIDLHKCINCDLCIPVCPTNAIPSSLDVIKHKCIGCGFCYAVCPKSNVISFSHDKKSLEKVLPDCLEAGAENIELHAGVADNEIIMKEWELINTVNNGNFNSMCLDRLHLSNFSLENRVKASKEIAGDRLIIQADGYPMSGGKDDYNTTLQAIATADVINKRFNKKFDRKLKAYRYLENSEIYLLLSGGTNSLTSILAKQTDVRYNGVSIGSFARIILKDYINSDNFYNNDLLQKAYLIAKKLVTSNI